MDSTLIDIDPERILSALWWLDVVPGASELLAGQELTFAWRVNPAATRNWIDAQIELFLTDDASGEDRPLWRRHTGWPPTPTEESVPVPPGGWAGIFMDDGSTAFPPPGYLVERPYFGDVTA